MLKIVEKNQELSALLDKGSPEWAKEIRKRAKTLAGEIDTSYMGLAEVLWEINATPAYGDPNRGPVYLTLFKYPDFGQFCEEELHIHKAKAARLLKIWQTVGIDLAGLDPKVKNDLVGLGFSKVRELTRVISLENASGWVKKGQELSYPKLSQAISAYVEAQTQFKSQIVQQKTEALGIIKAADAGELIEPAVLAKAKEIMAIPLESPIKIDPQAINPDTSSPFNFSLYPDQREVVLQALEVAGKMTHSVKKSYNLTMICMDFLANHVAGADDGITSYLSRLETLLGVKLIALDTQSDQVVFGAKNIG